MLGRGEWKVFSQVRTRDHDELPAVLTREQVARLLGAIRLRRYRTPVKLIYCAGLRLSEPSRRGGGETDCRRQPAGFAARWQGGKSMPFAHGA